MKTKALLIALLVSGLASAASSQTPPRENWAHSCYTYKDMNFSGVFDMGDKPYADLQIEVTRPDGTKSWLNSNIDGFANLQTSLGNNESDVFEPGMHEVRAIYPAGWQSPSSSDRQGLQFVINRDAGGLLVPEETCRPIGVVPVLSISGSLVPTADNAFDEYTVKAVSREGLADIPLPITPNGSFSGIGERGKWRLEIRDPSDTLVYARDFEIVYGAVIFSEIDLSKDIAPELGAVYSEINFDDLLVTNSLFELPSGYSGLNWLNWISVHNRFYEGSGYVNNTVSSEFVAYVSSGVPGEIWSDRPFDFKGTYIGVAWPRGEEDEVMLRAWRGEEIVHTDRLLLTDNGPVYFDANYEDITKLVISHGNYERVVIDNFHYKQ